MKTCYTCNNDGKCGMTSSPKQCGRYKPQSKALDEGKGEQDEKDYLDRITNILQYVGRCSGA